eukprot:12917393-Prorocentrum_lima.AAC.1
MPEPEDANAAGSEITTFFCWDNVADLKECGQANGIQGEERRETPPDNLSGGAGNTDASSE